MHALIEERLAAFARNPAPADIYEFLLRTAFDAWSLIFLGRVQPAEVYDCFIEVATLLNRRLMWKLPFGRTPAFGQLDAHLRGAGHVLDADPL